jgi:hypothetical protein
MKAATVRLNFRPSVTAGGITFVGWYRMFTL